MKLLLSIVMASTLVACSRPNNVKTDANGETTVGVDPNSLDANGCPKPQDLRITNANGKQLTVLRVDKKDGKCVAKVKEE